MASKRTPPQAWFRDPTVEAAIRNETIREREAKRRNHQTEHPKVYICSPYKGDTEVNVQNALRYCRFAVEQGYFPIAPHCYLPRFMDDGDPEERKLALSFGLRLLYGCAELWVFGDKISEGMKLEILAAKQRNIRIRLFSQGLTEV